MSEIRVEHIADAEYEVTVVEGSGSTTHRVTVSDDSLERFAAESTPEALLEASFRFLLEREPKEAILETFDLPMIAHYFPDYPGQLSRYLG